MARGKEAAASAKRREQEAQTQARELAERLATVKEEHRRETARLRDEIIQLRSGINKESAVLAEQRVMELHDRLEASVRKAVLAGQRTQEVMEGKDDLVRNACWYLSMTRGVPPFLALIQVATWLTGLEDLQKSGPEKFLERNGFPANGWVARVLRHHKNQIPIQKTLVVGLDTVEEDPEKFEIHSSYRNEWYKPGVYI